MISRPGHIIVPRNFIEAKKVKQNEKTEECFKLKNNNNKNTEKNPNETDK